MAILEVKEIDVSIKNWVIYVMSYEYVSFFERINKFRLTKKLYFKNYRQSDAVSIIVTDILNVI